MKNKNENRKPVPDKVKKGFRRYCTAVMAAAVLCCCTVPAFAADDPLAVINNLSNFIFGLIRAVGSDPAWLGYRAGRSVASVP